MILTFNTVSDSLGDLVEAGVMEIGVDEYSD